MDIDISEFLTNSVRAVAISTSTNASADDLRPYTADPDTLAAWIATSPGTAYLASVQQGPAIYDEALAAAQGVQAGRATFVVFFGTPPADGGRVLGARDVILWPDPNGTTRVLLVGGPRRDEGGAGVGWSVDCVEVA